VDEERKMYVQAYVGQINIFEGIGNASLVLLLCTVHRLHMDVFTV
jgi:hypothetical protein